MKTQTTPLGTTQALVTAVVKTFSDMAFIDAVDIPDYSEDLSFSHILHISLHEPQKGQIVLFLPYACKKMIVENIYGRDWDSLHATEIDDCLLEILNVLAGNFLNEFCEKEITHGISLPKMLFDDTEIYRKSNCFTDYFFDAEGIPFKISITISNSS